MTDIELLEARVKRLSEMSPAQWEQLADALTQERDLLRAQCDRQAEIIQALRAQAR